MLNIQCIPYNTRHFVICSVFIFFAFYSFISHCKNSAKHSYYIEVKIVSRAPRKFNNIIINLRCASTINNHNKFVFLLSITNVLMHLCFRIHIYTRFEVCIFYFSNWTKKEKKNIVEHCRRCEISSVIYLIKWKLRLYILFVEIIWSYTKLLDEWEIFIL